MRSIASRHCAPFASVLLALAACGGSGEPTIDGAPSGAAFDPAAISDDPIGTNAACVTSLAQAALPAVNLVLMYDKSGSMGNPAEGGDPQTKWVPVNAGMKAFFADGASAGYNASLQFFPAPGDLNATCSAPYATPLVSLTPLSKSAPLVSALEHASPQGGTPTLPALQGALDFAAKTARARPAEKTVVVLVTDGEPGLMVDGKFSPGCANNDVDHVAAAAAKALQGSPPISTYVIGVGPSLRKLNAVAGAGGTGQAMMISVANPAETASQLQKALESIRSAVKLTCDLPLPAAPSGQRLDVRRVNVALTASGGATTPLVYSKDCSLANGWHYDDLASPTRIELCPASCNTAQSNRDGKVSVALGCVTNGIPK
jgi:hypothetical protein